MTDVLNIPGEQEFLNEFGESPQPLEESWIRSITITAENGDLALSYDTHEKSIRFEWSQGNDVLWEFFRETATSLSIRSERGETHFIVEFDSVELSGELDVRVFPAVAVKDSLMRG
ncbi:hypothetical protein [Saccharopolyspora shandongensis]|uniref:hypothetical protein n=1 Tax=Saccharopolyspora shandongensis TaxID=418495 RepID=UPI0033CDA163